MSGLEPEEHDYIGEVIAEDAKRRKVPTIGGLVGKDVPPAGGEVEVFTAIDELSAEAAENGNSWHAWSEPRAELVKAHVTYLTAENARLQGELKASGYLFNTKRRVNRELRAHVTRLQAELISQRNHFLVQLQGAKDADAPQSELAKLADDYCRLADELTKARELLSEVCDSIANPDHYRKVFAYLDPSARAAKPSLQADEIHQMAFEEGQPAENGDGYLFTAEEFDLFVERLLTSQSAPAAKCETPTSSDCPGDGVGECKRCPNAPAAKGESDE